jgi:phosphoglycolate phosphatase
MATPVINLLITDLDNTLYDWVSSFVPAFYGMVDAAAELLSVDREQLLDELREVHQRYRNVEQPFALLETETVVDRYPNASRLERKNELEGVFRVFSDIRRERLRPYPGVRETLAAIRTSGCAVVGYTEAVVENSLYRLKLLGLTDLLQRLYAPEGGAGGHPDPSRRSILEGFADYVYLLPPGHRKPDPAVLADICVSHHVRASRALYVGDNQEKDITMAKAAGVHAAWARYGHAKDPETWGKLVRVTFWSQADTERKDDPDCRVKLDSFAELLQYYAFKGLDAA